MKRDPRLAAILTDKKELRDKTAAKPFAKKLRILERMRERDNTLRTATAPKHPRTGSSKKK